MLSLNLIDVFVFSFLDATADECNDQLHRSPWGAQCGSIYEHTPLSVVGADFNLFHCYSLYPPSVLFCSGTSPTTVKVCMESFRDGSGSTGILCLKKLNKITEIKELSAEELSVKPVVLSMSETLKSKFTKQLKGLYPPPPPTSLAH